MFRKAERTQARLRLALTSPSGGGKTHSALLIAAGLGGRIAVLDTEHGSASLEVGKPNIPDFDVCPLDPPYSVARYLEAISGAAEAGYSVLIIDSLTHAWTGEGGILDAVEMARKASRSGNAFTDGWGKVGTPQYKKLVSAILSSPIHIIGTLRTKTAWEIQQTSNGKKAPVKIGLAPEQRQGFEYEFTLVLDLAVDGHVATASKDRTSLFDGRNFVPSANTGKELLAWLGAGEPVPASEPEQQRPPKEPTPEQKSMLLDLKMHPGPLKSNGTAEPKPDKLEQQVQSWRERMTHIRTEKGLNQMKKVCAAQVPIDTPLRALLRPEFDAVEARIKEGAAAS